MTRQLTSLEFYAKFWDFNKKEFVDYNIFGNSRVLFNVACYVTMPESERKDISDPLLYCFSKLWGHVEYEFGVCEVFCDSMDKVQKVDIYEFYVKPNRKYLLELIESVSKNSATKYLREYRKALKSF